MSELKVNIIQPSTSSVVTITPSLVVTNATQTSILTISDNSVTITCPLRVGSSPTDVTAGVAYTTTNNRTAVGIKTPQHLTSRGAGLSPVWTEGVPYGGIMMWWGLPTNVPTGWVLCDGRSYLISGLTWQTPDLRDRFIVGAGSTYAAGNIGGSPDAVVVSHTHQISPNPHGHSGSGNVYSVGCRVDCDDDGGWAGASEDPPALSLGTTYLTVSTEGVPGANKNLPPYHALCFIMKVPTS